MANLLTGAVAGALAGLAGTWLMTHFQTAWSQVEEAEKEPKKGDQGTPESEEHEPATVKTAEAISRKVFHYELRPEEKEIAGNATHFAFGTLCGAVYGAVAESAPAVSALDGTVFGAGVWMAADNLAVPAVGLSKWPHQVPISKNIYGLASHLVYGFGTEMMRRLLRRLL